MAKGRKRRKPDVKVGPDITYADLPDSMSSCYYDLKLKEVKELDSGNIAFVWKVLDTDTKVELKTKVSTVLFPFAKLAERYYWRELFEIQQALNGEKLTQEVADEMSDEAEAWEAAALDMHKDFVGSKRVRLQLRARFDDEGERSKFPEKRWRPLED